MNVGTHVYVCTCYVCMYTTCTCTVHMSCIYMYTCMYVYTHTYILHAVHVHMKLHIYTYMNVYIHTCTYMYVCTLVCMYVHSMYVCVCVCTCMSCMSCMYMYMCMMYLCCTYYFSRHLIFFGFLAIDKPKNEMPRKIFSRYLKHTIGICSWRYIQIQGEQ
jgi:hypothetical protein